MLATWIDSIRGTLGTPGCAVLIAVCAYLLGSLSFAIIVCRLTLGHDIREYGSGNAGLTNAFRTMGAGKTLLVLLGDTAKAAAALSAQIQEHRFQKEYFAVVQGSVQPPRGVLQDYLYHDKRKGKAYAVKSLRKGVKQAELEYKTLAEAAQNGETISLVWVRLHTGRFHQIRAQFAARKMPLLGDGRYGSREKGCGTALFSCGVGFAAPAGGKEVFVRQMPPRAFPWNVFAEALYDL